MMFHSKNYSVDVDSISLAASYVRSVLKEQRPFVGIVLGSGLGKLSESIGDRVEIPYKNIPGFPVSTAIGHKGVFVAGTLGGKYVLAMQGRIHSYEGYPMEMVVLPARVMAALGIRYFFVSNAAGGVNYDFRIGDLMVLKDHISLIPNPLIGPNKDALGPRFPDMTRPYDPALIALAKKVAAERGIALREGVYLADTGPCYETPAEYRFYRTVGADAVGMSTVPEVIAMRHAGIPVFGMSVITNEAHDDYADDFENNGEEVIAAADLAADRMTALFTAMIEAL